MQHKLLQRIWSDLWQSSVRLTPASGHHPAAQGPLLSVISFCMKPATSGSATVLGTKDACPCPALQMLSTDHVSAMWGCRSMILGTAGGFSVTLHQQPSSAMAKADRPDHNTGVDAADSWESVHENCGLTSKCHGPDQSSLHWLVMGRRTVCVRSAGADVRPLPLLQYLGPALIQITSHHSKVDDNWRVGAPWGAVRSKESL